MPRRYKVEWELDSRMRSTTYSTIEAARREINSRLRALGHLQGRAFLFDQEARRWQTYYLVPGGRTRGGGQMNPVLHTEDGA